MRISSDLLILYELNKKRKQMERGFILYHEIFHNDMHGWFNMKCFEFIVDDILLLKSKTAMKYIILYKV